MPRTPTFTLIDRLFTRFTLLLIAYAIVELLTAIMFLDANALAAWVLAYLYTTALSSILGQSAALTGAIAGALWFAATRRGDNRAVPEGLLIALGRGWLIFVVVAGLAALLGGFSSLAGLSPVASLLLIVQSALLIGFAFVIVRTGGGRGIPLIAAVGLILIVVGNGVDLIEIHPMTTAHWVFDRLVIALRQIGLTLLGLAVIYGIFHRVSNVTLAWAEPSLYTTAGLVTIAVAFDALGPAQAWGLYLIAQSGLLNLLGMIGTAIAPLLWLIVLAHAYRALSDRNPTITLAGAWVGFAVVAWALAALVNVMHTVPALMPYLAGTLVIDLARTLHVVGALAVGAGALNQVRAEQRGENRRITGLIPFWLITFGTIGGGLALAAAGIVQGYLERVLGLGYLEVQTLLIPLYAGWVIGTALILLGTIAYGLGAYARRLR